MTRYFTGARSLKVSIEPEVFEMFTRKQIEE